MGLRCVAPPQALFTALQSSEVCIWAACPQLPFFPWKEMGTSTEKFSFPVFRWLPEDERICASRVARSLLSLCRVSSLGKSRASSSESE